MQTLSPSREEDTRSRIGGKRIVDIAGMPAEQTDAVPAHEVSPCFARRRVKATSEQGQPRVRCPLTKESSDVVSGPSEPPGRASPTSALLGLQTFAGVPNIQMSTFSPLAYRVQTGQLGRRVRLVRFAYQVDEGPLCQPSTRLRGALCRLCSPAKQPEPAKPALHEAVS